MNTVTENRAQYLAWLRRDFPALYRDLIPQMSVPYVSGTPDFTAPSLQLLRWESPGIASTSRSGHPSLEGFWDSVGTTFNSVVSQVTNALPQLASTYAQYQQQRDVLRMNTQRASAGQAPMQYVNGQWTPVYDLPYTPQERVLASTGLSTEMMLGIAALAGVGLLMIRGR